MASTRRQASLSTIGEFNLIHSIATTRLPRSSGVILGIGDDAAVFRVPPNRHLVISTDLLVEHVHFSRSFLTFFDIGYKAAAANLSDMAAMGAQPSGLLVAVALSPKLTFRDWKELYRGLSIPCQAHNVHLIGGDTSASPSACFLALTITGSVKPGCELRRGRARKGDWIFVSGTLGDSAAGLDVLKVASRKKLSRFPPSHPLHHLVERHLHPIPRVALGRFLGSRHLASAAIDISDGLSSDLSHLCQQSGVGALISAAKIPISSTLREFAVQKHIDPLHWALHGGEDYELLFTAHPQNGPKILTLAKRLQVPITQIGTITSRQSWIRMVHPDGTLKPFPPRGFEHFHD